MHKPQRHNLCLLVFCFFSSVFCSFCAVQLCREDPGPTWTNSQTAGGRDRLQDYGARKGLHARQEEGTRTENHTHGNLLNVWSSQLSFRLFTHRIRCSELDAGSSALHKEWNIYPSIPPPHWVFGFLPCPGVQSICPPFLSPGVCSWTESAQAFQTAGGASPAFLHQPPSSVQNIPYPTLPHRERERDTHRDREEGKHRHSGRQKGEKRERCWLLVHFKMIHLTWQNIHRGYNLPAHHAEGEGFIVSPLTRGYTTIFAYLIFHAIKFNRNMQRCTLRNSFGNYTLITHVITHVG